MLAGLESCPGLQHLTLADQRSAEPLTFSRPALAAVGGCLQTLDVSGCRIASLRPLQLLRAIETLNCDRNDISDMVEVAELLRSARWMSDFSLRDNPVSALRNYRHKAIAVSQPSLRECLAIGDRTARGAQPCLKPCSGVLLRDVRWPPSPAAPSAGARRLRAAGRLAVMPAPIRTV